MSDHQNEIPPFVEDLSVRECVVDGCLLRADGQGFFRLELQVRRWGSEDPTGRPSKGYRVPVARLTMSRETIEMIRQQFNKLLDAQPTKQ